MNVIHIVALACTLTSFVMLVVALTTRHWVDIGQSYSGLWEVCFTTIIGSSCVGYGNSISDHIHVTRAFLCLAIICIIPSLVLLGIAFFRSHIAAFPVVMIAASANVIAGGFALIALSTFTAVEVPNQYFGWSFGLGWVCIPMCIGSGVLAYKTPPDVTI